MTSDILPRRSPLPDNVIELCLAGKISPQVAMVRLLTDGAAAEEIIHLIEQRRADPRTARWQALVRFAEGHKAAMDFLSAEIAATGGDQALINATPESNVDRIAAFFDHAVAHSPEASVALHSLGDAQILSAATAEIVGWLEAEGLLAASTAVVDLGCGIGRLALALGQRCRSVLGLDVSTGMVAEARRRCADLDKVRIELTSGRNLASLANNAFDLVLAADSFPYIMQLGTLVADAHVADVARALRPGGVLAILNLSYRDDLALDQADAVRWSTMFGFELQHCGTSPFLLWDGQAFVLCRV